MDINVDGGDTSVIEDRADLLLDIAVGRHPVHTTPCHNLDKEYRMLRQDDEYLRMKL